MSSSPTTSLLALTLAGLLGVGVSACSKDDPPATVQPPAGVLKPADLPGNPSVKALTSDEGVTRYCGPVHEMQIQENAKGRYIVEYELDDHTVVRSYKYTYGTEKRRTADIAALRAGISRCAASNVGLAADTEKFTAVPGLPTTTAGYHTSQQDSSGSRIAERIWASRGDKEIVSVVVLYQGGPDLAKLPADAAQLAAKAAAES